VQASQRSAIAAAAAIDKSGLMLQKWAMTGDSIVDKLSRFEEHVQRMDGDTHKSPSTPSRDAAVSSQATYAPSGVKQPQMYRQPSERVLTAAAPTSASKRGSLAVSPQKAPQSVGTPQSAQPGGFASTANMSPGYTSESRSPQLLRQASSASMGGRSVTDPQAAQLSRQGSQQLSPQGRSPLSRSATVSGTRVAQQEQAQPLVHKLMSRPLQR
jgi:hypothetical protein